MSELQSLIEACYEQAKTGKWQRVLADWQELPLLARRCSRYQKASSGWGFLHQAAYFGNEAACRELIRMGASIRQLSLKRETAIGVAQNKGHNALAALLRRARLDEGSLWAVPCDPDLLPSSCLWDEALECRATETLLVAYGGGVVKIPHGSRYFTDAFGRVLVGWHGTYDPPCGMDGESMIAF